MCAVWHSCLLILHLVSPQGIAIFRFVRSVFDDTSVLMCCYCAFVLPILGYCSPAEGSAAECHLQLLERLVRFVSRFCPYQIIETLNHRRRVAGLSMSHKLYYNSMFRLCGELSSASHRVSQYIPWWLSIHTLVAVATHRNELNVQRWRISQFARWFLPAYVRAWNGLPDAVFESGSLSGFKRVVNLWLLSRDFFKSFCSVGARWVAHAICKSIVFYHFGLHC